MHRRSFLAAAGALAFAPAAQSQPRAVAAMADFFGDLKNGDFGADLSGRDFVGVLQGLHPEALAGTSLEVANAAPPTARRVVLENLPSIATQGVPGSLGDPGSCEAQSFGYGIGTYTAARKPNGDRKWDASLPENQVSAAWLYQWQHVDDGSKACPSGSMAVPYAQKLVATGAPSAAAFPYNPDNAVKVGAVCAHIETYDVATTPGGASRFLIGSYKGYSDIHGNKAKYLETFKALIRNGHAIAFSGLVPKQYCIESPPMQNDAFVAPSGFIPKSGHGQLIVGFNDNKGPGGAFLIQNSFGPGWNPGSDAGHNGRIWFDYDQWFASQYLALIEYSNNDAPPAGTRLEASAPDAPHVFLKEARTYRQGGNAYLALILHANDAFTVNQITVTGPKGLAATQQLNEFMRFGYVYVERKPAFQRDRYAVQLDAHYGGGKPVTYKGEMQVT